jgi:hypothetical protein
MEIHDGVTGNGGAQRESAAPPIVIVVRINRLVQSHNRTEDGEARHRLSRSGRSDLPAMSIFEWISDASQG